MDMGYVLAKLGEHWIYKVIGGVLTWLVLEGVRWLPARAALTLFFLIGLDTALGFGYAIYKHEVESERMRRGLLKVLLYWLVLLVINLLAKSQAQWAGLGQTLQIFIFGYLLSTEAVSVLEKVSLISMAAGIDLPVIGAVLERLKAAKRATP
jgi:hypothetical protein